MANKTSLLGFAGSLRKGSYNKSLISAAVGLLPEDATLEIFDLEGIPPFNQDLENAPPQKVVEFKSRIRACDALVISTPEHNYSVPGVLKNAIDWASRPYGDNAFDGKPVAIMSASIGMLGGARAQYHLRQMFIFLNMYPLNAPEVMVANAAQKFGPDGKLLDEKGRELVRALLKGLVEWTRRLGKK